MLISRGADRATRTVELGDVSPHGIKGQPEDVGDRSDGREGRSRYAPCLDLTEGLW